MVRHLCGVPDSRNIGVRECNTCPTHVDFGHGRPADAIAHIEVGSHCNTSDLWRARVDAVSGVRMHYIVCRGRSRFCGAAFRHFDFVHFCGPPRDLEFLPAGPGSSSKVSRATRAGVVELALSTKCPCRIVRCRQRWSWGQSLLTFGVRSCAGPCSFFLPSAPLFYSVAGAGHFPSHTGLARDPARHLRLQQAQRNCPKQPL